MSLFFRTVAMAVLVVATGCANQASTKNNEAAATPAAKTPDVGANVAKSKDSRVEGEVVGTPAKNSKFAKLKIGHTFREVTDLIGAPDDIHRHETGKRWIPFYYGGDAQRMQVYYKGEGCLTYTGGNVFGGGGNELIRITVDAKGGCWK